MLLQFLLKYFEHYYVMALCCWSDAPFTKEEEKQVVTNLVPNGCSGTRDRHTQAYNTSQRLYHMQIEEDKVYRATFFSSLRLAA